MLSAQPLKKVNGKLVVEEALPGDVWFELAALLEPRTLLALQSTCKALRTLLNTRSVWSTALRALCARHALFLPSFPIDEMDLGQLQHAVFGPERYAALVEAHAGDPRDTWENEHVALTPLPPPMSSAPSSPPAIPLAEEAHGAFLVPGGRYLVAVDGEAANVLKLWDLGPACRPLDLPVLVAERVLEGDEVVRGEIASGARGERWERSDSACVDVVQVPGGRLRVAVWVPMRVNAVTIQVFDIDGLGDGNRPPTFRRLGVLHFRSDALASMEGYWCSTMSLYTKDACELGDCVLARVEMNDESTTFVWNYGEGWYVRLPGRGPRAGLYNSSAQILVGESIVHFTGSEVLVWHIPSLGAERVHVGTSAPAVLQHDAAPAPTPDGEFPPATASLAYRHPLRAGQRTVGCPQVPGRWDRKGGREMNFSVEIIDWVQVWADEDEMELADAHFVLKAVVRYRVKVPDFAPGAEDPEGWLAVLGCYTVEHPAGLAGDVTSTWGPDDSLQGGGSTTVYMLRSNWGPGATVVPFFIASVEDEGDDLEKVRAGRLGELRVVGQEEVDSPRVKAKLTKLLATKRDHLIILGLCTATGRLVYIDQAGPVFPPEPFNPDRTLYISSYLNP